MTFRVGVRHYLRYRELTTFPLRSDRLQAEFAFFVGERSPDTSFMASRRPTVTLIVCCVAVLAGIAIKYDSSQDESSAKALADPKGMGRWPGKTQAVIAPKKSPIL